MTERPGENKPRGVEEILRAARLRNRDEKIIRGRERIDAMPPEQVSFFAQQIRELGGAEKAARASCPSGTSDDDYYYEIALDYNHYLLDKERSLGSPDNNSPN